MSSSVTSPAPGDQCSLCHVVTTSVASSRRSSHGRSVITGGSRRAAQRAGRSAPSRQEPLACTMAGSGSRKSNVRLDGVRPASRASARRSGVPSRARRAQVRRRDDPAAAVVHGPGEDGTRRPAERRRGRRCGAGRRRRPGPGRATARGAGSTSISLERPSRGSSRNSVWAIAVEAERGFSSVSASSTTSSRQRASPIRQVPKPRGICTSLRPQNSPSAVPGGVGVGADRPERRVVARDDLLQHRLAARRPRRPRPAPPASAQTSTGRPKRRLNSDPGCRLDDGRVAQLAPRPRRPRSRCRRGRCAGRRCPAALRGLDWCPLALQRLEHVPAAAGQL